MPGDYYLKEHKRVVLVEVSELHVLEVSDDLTDKKISIRIPGTANKLAKFVGSDVERGVYRTVKLSLNHVPYKLQVTAVCSEPSCFCKSHTYRSVINLTELANRLRPEVRLGFWKSQLLYVSFEGSRGELIRVMMVVSLAWGFPQGTAISYQLRQGAFQRVVGSSEEVWGPVAVPGTTRLDDAAFTATHRLV